MTPRRRRRYYVFTADLHREVASRSRVRRRNPDRMPDAPCVYVGYTSARLLEQYEDGDFGASRSRLLRNHGAQLRDDPRVSGHSKREGALSRQQRLIRERREEGWTVANPHPPKDCCVYVIELRPKVAELSRVQTLNPNRDPNEKCVYVGQTNKTPEERFQEHLDGVRASRYVQKYGVKLLPCLYEGLSELTELESLRKERQRAAQLRRQGYTVLGGH